MIGLAPDLGAHHGDGAAALQAHRALSASKLLPKAPLFFLLAASPALVVALLVALTSRILLVFVGAVVLCSSGCQATEARTLGARAASSAELVRLLLEPVLLLGHL